MDMGKDNWHKPNKKKIKLIEATIYLKMISRFLYLNYTEVNSNLFRNVIKYNQL